VFKQGTRDIASIAADGSDFRYELQTGSDERDARWTPDGAGIVFASDRTGIFNIYRMDAASGEVVQLSNVIGGAFMPDPGPDGAVVYSEYTADGYNVSLFSADTPEVATLAAEAYATRATGEFEECEDVKGELGMGLVDGGFHELRQQIRIRCVMARIAGRGAAGGNR
jgi:hypothetical protein